MRFGVWHDQKDLSISSLHFRLCIDGENISRFDSSWLLICIFCIFLQFQPKDILCFSARGKCCHLSSIADNRNWLLGTECSLLHLQISSATWDPTNRNNLGWFEQIWISDSQIANNKSQGPLFLRPCWRWKTENFKSQTKKYKFQITNYKSCASLDTHKDLTKAVWKKDKIRFLTLNEMRNYLFCCILPWCDYQSCWADILDLQSCIHVFLKHYCNW